MKKLLFLLFAFVTVSMQAQTANGSETQFEGLQLTDPQTVTSVNYLSTMGSTGVIGKIDPILLPLSTATINAINTNSALKENIANKQNSLTVDATNTKYPTVTAVIAGLSTKQNTITNPVTGTGTSNYLPKFTGSSSIGASQLFDNGSNVGINTSNPSMYGHAGTGKTLEILNTNTSLDAQSHLILSSNSTLSNSSIGSITWAMPNVSNSNKMVGYINISTENTHTSASPKTSMAFVTNNSGSLQNQMIITSSGYVGIGNGASTPNNTLDVSNTANSQISLGNGSAVGRYDLGRFVSNGFLKFYGYQTGATGYVFDGIDGERMSINASGIVKINNLAGATSALLETDVNGNISRSATVMPTSGAYIPTLTAGSNMTSLVLNSATYSKVGNVVTCRISVGFSTTLATSVTAFTATLPVNKATISTIEIGNGNSITGGVNNSGSVNVRATSASVLSADFISGASFNTGGKATIFIQYDITQ